jgi:hypothetical protein
MNKKRTPHRLNVAGDFYVEDGCCTACDLPQGEAPGHFAYDNTEGYDHCYICKQPKSDEEVKNMMMAMQVQEIDCIRYKGVSQNVLDTMKKEGLEEYSDILEPYFTGTSEKGSFLKKLIGIFK